MKENKNIKFKVRAIPNANSLDEALIKEDFIKLTEADETVHDKEPEKKVHQEQASTSKCSRSRSSSAVSTSDNEVRVQSPGRSTYETVAILSEYIDEQQKLLDKYDDITMGLIKVIEKQSAMIDGYQKVIGLVLYNGNDERT